MQLNNILRTFIRLILGVLFIFSGYVKAIDPMGSAIKFGEYFEAFGMSALEPGALAFGILLALAELLIGLAFLFGMRMKIASWGALLFMLFFTGLTLVLALTDAVRDCGCFGDAVKLTNWETFYKNLIILPFVIYVFWQRNKYGSLFCNKVEWGIALLVTLACTSISVYAYRHLPFIDFMPYKVGVNIFEAMKMPEGAPVDEYESTFIYEKDGVSQNFTIENLPDSTWSFVDTKSKLIKQGYTPPAKDFTISDDGGDYIQHDVLSQPGYLIFLTSPDAALADRNKLEQINEIYAFSTQNNVRFMFLSGSSGTVNNEFLSTIGVPFQAYHTDETVLKSMVRSNPGLMLLKDGVILKKWNNRDMPSVANLTQLMTQDPQKIINAHASNTARTNVILGIITALLFMVFSIKGLKGRKRK